MLPLRLRVWRGPALAAASLAGTALAAASPAGTALAAVSPAGTAPAAVSPAGTALAGGTGAGAPDRAATHTAPCLVPGVGRPLDQVWRPHMLAAIGYTDTRTGDITFAVRTDDRFYGYRPNHVEWSASVVKAMLMVAYLNEPWVRSRALNARENQLLTPMITESDNDAAQQVFDTVGQPALRALARRVGMSHFATSPIWGETQITAADETRFFLHIDRYIVPRHRAYAMSLLAGIVPSQRWGIGEVAPNGWKLYFKGGWGYGTGLLDHQVVLLVRGCVRISIAVLTMRDGSHAYGKDTLKGIFARLLRGLPIRRKRTDATTPPQNSHLRPLHSAYWSSPDGR